MTYCKCLMIQSVDINISSLGYKLEKSPLTFAYYILYWCRKHCSFCWWHHLLSYTVLVEIHQVFSAVLYLFNISRWFFLSSVMELRNTVDQECIMRGNVHGLPVSMVFFGGGSKPSPFHLHEIMILRWCDHKLLFSRVPIRHATVNKSLNHCRSGLGQRTIQKPLFQMAH